MYNLFNTLTKVFLPLYFLIKDYNYEKYTCIFLHRCIKMNLWKEFVKGFEYISIRSSIGIKFRFFFFFIKFLIQLNLLISQEEHIHVCNIITCSYVIFNKYLIQKSKTRKKTAEQSFYLKFRKTTISTILEMDRYH